MAFAPPVVGGTESHSQRNSAIDGTPSNASNVTRRPSIAAGFTLDKNWERDIDAVDVGQSLRLSRAVSLHTANRRFAEEVEKVTHAHAAAHGYENGCFSQYLNRFVISPTSPLGIFWEGLFACFVVYDFVNVPLILLDPPSTPLSRVVTWCSRIFWTLSIPKHFFTGIMSPSGNAEMRFSAISAHYMRTFLAFDVIVVATDWIEIVLDDVKNVSSVKAIKMFRVLRLLRVVRLAKVTKGPDIVMKVLAYVFSERFLLVMDIVKVTIILALIVHYSACGWYALGSYLKGYDTWVDHYEVDKDSADIFTRWATSAHWAVANYMGAADIFPQNAFERLAAAASLLVGFVISACLQARITASMTRLQHLGGNHDIRLASLRQFLNNRGISPDLSVRVMTCATHVMRANGLNMSERDVHLFSQINEDLQIEIHTELYSPTLTQHPFLRGLYRVDGAVFNRICHLAVDMRNLVTGDRLFSQGEVASPPQLYFIVEGTLLYAKDGWETDEDLRYVTVRQWAAEPAIYLSRWAHLGGLRALTGARALVVNGPHFCRLCKEEARSPYSMNYAREFVEQLRDAQDEGMPLDDIFPGFDAGDLARIVLQRDHPDLRVTKTFSSITSSTRLFNRSTSYIEKGVGG